MNPRSRGRPRPCTVADARARLTDATAFLEAAERASNPDVIATNAIHAAIAAADAICCIALRERSGDGSHTTAVDLLERVDTRLSAALSRCLDRKTQAAYETRDLSSRDAAACVKRALTLVEAARARVTAV